MVTNSSDWNIVDGSRSRTEDDVVTIIFFNGTNTDAFDAFDDIEVQGGSAVRGGTGSIPCSFGIDTTYVPPGIITSTSSSSMVKNDTMMIGEHTMCNGPIVLVDISRRFLLLKPTCYASFVDLSNRFG